MKPWKIAALVCTVAACACMLMAGCQSETYTPQLKEQTVSSAALGQDGVLRVGVNADSAPLAGQTESSSRIVGIDAEVAAYLADQMGLKVQLIDVGNDPEAALEAGTVDIVLGVDASTTDASYWRSPTYIGKGVVLFGSSNESAIPAAGADSSVAAQEGTWSEKRVVDLLGADALVTVKDLKTALENVANGSVRYAAGDVLAGSYLASYYEYGVKVLASMQEPGGYCVAVAQSNTELQGAVTSAVDTLVNGGMMDIIETEWIGAPLDLDKLTIMKGGSEAETAAADTAADDAAAADEAAEGEGEAAAAEGEGEAAAEGEAA